MIIFKKRDALQEHLSQYKGKKIGFVPTMGALHRGHTSLLVKAKVSCDVVVCSIFVNPTQFNNPKDFERYPIKTDEDILALESVGCDVIQIPSRKCEDIYRETDFEVDLGLLTK